MKSIVITFLLTSVIQSVSAQAVCGKTSTIGNNNTVEYKAENDKYTSTRRLFLNTANPALCNGTITNWTYCYYTPRPRGPYTAEFALFRPRGSQYREVRTSKLSIMVSVDESSSESNFQCAILIPQVNVNVEQDDIIGVSLSGEKRLDIISNTEDTADFNADTVLYFDYKKNIPGSINNNKLIEIQNRVIHLFAEIINNDGSLVSIGNGVIRSITVTPTGTGNVQLETTKFTLSGVFTEEVLNTAIFTSRQLVTSVILSRTVTDITQLYPSSSIAGVLSDEILNTVTLGGSHLSHSSLILTTTIMTSIYKSLLLSTVIVSPTSVALESASRVQTSLVKQTITTSTTVVGQPADTTPTKSKELRSTTMVNVHHSTTVTTSPRQRIPQNTNNEGRIAALVVAIVFIVVTLSVLSVVVLIRKYKIKRRYRFFPSSQSSVRKVDYEDDDFSGTLAKFDNVIYSNYDEAVEFPRQKSQQHEYSAIDNTELRPIDSVYSVVQADLMYDSLTLCNYSALGPEKSYAQPDSQSIMEKNNPNRDSLLSVFHAPASEECELYAQLKFCGVKHINRDTIEITDYLGSGQFGDVKKGMWRNEKFEVQVALKTLKQGSKEEHKVKFLQEAAIMAQFSHPNVVILYGVVSKGEPIMLVVELVRNGCLLNHLTMLKENNSKTALPNLSKMLLNFSQQVALGMRHLSEKGFVHRDLAARNILVSSDNVCKIADFGMSRDLAEENYYVSHGGMIPVKWTAPEAINFKKYSTASDVWSYGCLLYEIWSLGHKPYESLSNMQVIRHVELGRRLPPPPGCPKKIYELIIFCWNPDVPFRPKFVDISIELIGDRNEVLGIPQEALDSHELAGVLGVELEAGEGMYQDLQNRYVLK